VLIKHIAKHLTENGLCGLVLPLETSALVKTLAHRYQLYLQKIISVHSFEESVPNREIVCFGLKNEEKLDEQFVIYDEPKVYSKMYINSLKDFFTIF